MQTSFWQLTFGNVISVISIFISFAGLILILLKFHRENRDNIQKGINELSDMRNKVEKMHNWFDSGRLQEMEIKLGIVYRVWFGNVKVEEQKHESTGD